MPAVFAEDAVDSPDLTGLRWSVRSDGRRGFVFVVNRHPGIDLPRHEGVRFEVGDGRGMRRHVDHLAAGQQDRRRPRFQQHPSDEDGAVVIDGQHPAGMVLRHVRSLSDCGAASFPTSGDI